MDEDPDGINAQAISELTGIGIRSVREKLGRGVFEGYITLYEVRDELARKNIYVWRKDKELPRLGDAKEKRKEIARIKGLPFEGDTDIYRLIDGKKTGVRLRLIKQFANRYHARDQKQLKKKAIKTKRRRALFRSRFMRKTQWCQYLVVWIYCRALKPKAPWAEDLLLFVKEVIGATEESSGVFYEEDVEFVRELERPWVLDCAKSGLFTRVLYFSRVKRLALQSKGVIERLLKLDSVREAVGHTDEHPWLDFKAADEEGEAFTFKARSVSAPSMKEPSFIAFGMDSGYTGQHGDVIFLDDIQDPSNCRGENLNRLKHLYHLLQPIMGRNMEAVMQSVGTLYDPSDLYHYWFEEQQKIWEFYFDPCLKESDYTVDDDGEVQIKETARSRFPRSMSMEFIREERIAMGSFEFSGQYLLSFLKIRPSFINPLDQGKWVDEDQIPEEVCTYILCDVADSDRPQACYTCFWVVQVDMARTVYVREVKIGRWLPKDSWEVLKDLLLVWPVRTVISEQNGFSRSFTQGFDQYALSHALRYDWEFAARDISERHKDSRIYQLEGPIVRGELRFDEELKANKQFRQVVVSQFVKFGKSKHKDGPDALTLWNAMDRKGNRMVRFSLGDLKKRQKLKDEALGIWRAPLRRDRQVPSPQGESSPYRVGYRRR